MTEPPIHRSLPRRSAEDTEGEVQRVMRKLDASGQAKTIQSLIANSPNMFRPFVVLSDTLMNRSRIPPFIREVVILWMAREQATSYEWAEHVPMAIAAGVTNEQIGAIRDGAIDYPALPEPAHLAVDGARSVLDGGGVAPGLWAKLVDEWGVDGALDLVFIGAWWGGFVPTVIGALGLTAVDVQR